MAEMITVTGTMNRPKIFSAILDYIRDPGENKGQFNTDIVRLLGKWYREDVEVKTIPNLLLIGLGSISSASVVRYGHRGDEVVVLEKLDEEVPKEPIIRDIIKTDWESEPGLIFHTAGDYSDGDNVGVWVPEQSVGILGLKVHVVNAPVVKV